MTDTDKLLLLKSLIGEKDLSETSDSELSAYLAVANNEILNWMYRLYDSVPENIKTIPAKYDMVQIQAVIAGYNLRGAENQTSHSENGINRSFKYADMLEYIHSNVISLVRVGG